jgi:hypothetical protein
MKSYILRKTEPVQSQTFTALAGAKAPGIFIGLDVPMRLRRDKAPAQLGAETPNIQHSTSNSIKFENEEEPHSTFNLQL